MWGYIPLEVDFYYIPNPPLEVDFMKITLIVRKANIFSYNFFRLSSKTQRYIIEELNLFYLFTFVELLFLKLMTN